MTWLMPHWWVSFRGERVTIPSLHNEAEWLAMENSRQAMMQHLSSNVPAERYRASMTH
ncbi:hypothetical protein DZS_20310 [Dickeya ananatis]